MVKHQGYGKLMIGVAVGSALLGCAMTGGGLTGPLQESIGACSPTPCAKVSLSSMPALPVALSAETTRSIQAEVAKVLYAPLDVQTDNPSREGILRELQDRVAEYKTLSDAPIDWTLTRTAQVISSNSRVTSVEVSSEGYLGGAHGFKERTLMTFDSRTGARLGVEDVVDDGARHTLSKIVEAEFRRARSVRRDQSLQEAGFFILPGQEMPLGENFAISDSGLEIQYNAYEIAPFSMGETRVRVPRDAIEPLVKADLRGAFVSDQAR